LPEENPEDDKKITGIQMMIEKTFLPDR